MNNSVEIRNTKPYIEAFAKYVKTGKADECRALLTTNAPANGTVPVPDFVYETVKRAWEREGIMTLVNRTNLKGNVKVGFEISATGAVVHTEGTDAPDEEQLVLGTVNLVPQSIKKWITISDEAIDLGGEEFLTYIYEELTHRIAKKAADIVVAKIDASPSSGTSAPIVPVLKQDMALGTIPSAIGLLSDEAYDITLMMNKSTWADFRALALQANYPLDIFDERRVVFNNTIKAYADATEDETYLLVGDLGYGVQANFPNGNDITLKYDDLSLAEDDLVKIVGRQYAAIEVVAPNAFVKVTKGA